MMSRRRTRAGPRKKEEEQENQDLEQERIRKWSYSWRQVVEAIQIVLNLNWTTVADTFRIFFQALITGVRK